MRSIITSLIISFFLLVNCPTSQASSTIISDENMNAIVQDINARYSQSYNARDVKTFVNLFTEKATFFSDGSLLANRKTLEKIITNTWPYLPEKLNFEMYQASSTAITSDVIVSQGVYYKNSSDDKKEAFTYTHILVSHDGIWRIATAHISKLK